MHEVHSTDDVIVADIRLKVATRQDEGSPQKRDVDRTRAPLRFQRRAAVPALFPSPKTTHQGAMIEREREHAARCDQASGGTQCVVHGSGVMQDSPSINHVEWAETAHVLAVQDRALLDRPLAVTDEIAVAQSRSAEDGILIEIERMHARAEFASGERKEPAA